MMVNWIFIATDTVFKGSDWDESKKQYLRMESAKIENVPTDKLPQYTPLCLFYMVGETDVLKRKINSIEKVKNGYIAKGVIFMGRPIPQSWTYTVDETFSFPNLYTGGEDTLATPLITKIITTEDGVINYVQALQAKMGRKIKMAEQHYAAEQETAEAESYGVAMESLAERLSMPKWLR
tara:strand:- start:122 stop:658 length:537 start_codon:yes stop_codon:yes gene_type:complete